MIERLREYSISDNNLLIILKKIEHEMLLIHDDTTQSSHENHDNPESSSSVPISPGQRTRRRASAGMISRDLGLPLS